jgi:nucleotide-binding universal stress UspA family protein
MTDDRPFPRIVVPTDGSHLSELAAQAAGELARRASVPLTLFGVTYTDHERDRLTKELDDLVATLRHDVVVEVIIQAVGAVMTVGGYVADAALDEANVDGALVCIASHGRSGVGAALLGSITEDVLRQSPRPVLVVGPRYQRRRWGDDEMLVACVDGSAFSEQAIAPAAQWSGALGLPMRLVQVADPNDAPAPNTISSGDSNERAYAQHLAEVCPRADYDVLHGHHPAGELAELTRRSPVAVMVMATHGRSGWSRLRLGSVAMNVVHHATCPILIVPREHALLDGDSEHASEAR